MNALAAAAEYRETVARGGALLLRNGTHYPGLKGEEAFASLCPGLVVDTSRKPNGDGGIDFTMHLVVDGAPHPFNVDVKSRVNFTEYLLVKADEKVHPRTIFVLARYDEAADVATCLCWCWGRQVLAAPRRFFPREVLNYTVRADDMRPLAELIDRYIAPWEVAAIAVEARR